MRERQLDRSRPTCGIARNDRRDPGQRGDREPLAARGQRREQRLGHHRVADPLRRDDERARHAGRAQSINARGPSRPAFRRYSVPQYGHLPTPVGGDVDEDARVVAPQRHLRVRAEHDARALQVGRGQLDRRASRISGCHRVQTLVSHSAYFGIAAVDDVEERALDLLGDRPARAARRARSGRARGSASPRRRCR